MVQFSPFKMIAIGEEMEATWLWRLFHHGGSRVVVGSLVMEAALFCSARAVPKIDNGRKIAISTCDLV